MSRGPNRFRYEVANLKTIEEKMRWCQYGPDLYQAAAWLALYDEGGIQHAGDEIAGMVDACCPEFFEEIATVLKRRQMAWNKSEHYPPDEQLEYYDPVGYALCAAWHSVKFRVGNKNPEFEAVVKWAREMNDVVKLPVSDGTIRNLMREMKLPLSSKRGKHLRRRNSHE